VSSALTAPKPNVVVIFCDDPGYGDLGSYGSPNIRTHPGELYDLRADLAQKQNLYGKEPKEPDKVKELQRPSALILLW
jgi:hypothetical protein